VPDGTMMPPCSEPSRHGLETAVFVFTTEPRPTLTAPARVGGCALRSGRNSFHEGGSVVL
jgi:hypothetical protein